MFKICNNISQWFLTCRKRKGEKNVGSYASATDAWHSQTFMGWHNKGSSQPHCKYMPVTILHYDDEWLKAGVIQDHDGLIASFIMANSSMLFVSLKPWNCAVWFRTSDMHQRSCCSSTWTLYRRHVEVSWLLSTLETSHTDKYKC